MLPPPAMQMPAAQPKPAEPVANPMSGAMAAAGAGATTPPAMTSTDPTAKEYTFEEVIALKRDDLIAAWSAAPAKDVWVGCAGKYRELKHAADGTPMATIPATWGGKCIPMDDKVLYNIVNGMPSKPGEGNTANAPAVVKDSSMDKKPAVIVTYPGGYELHFRNLGKNLWVGRQAVNGMISGTWYPLGDISGDGMRKP